VLESGSGFLLAKSVEKLAKDLDRQKYPTLKMCRLTEFESS
jgi:hypothetical protein